METTKANPQPVSVQATKTNPQPVSVQATKANPQPVSLQATKANPQPVSLQTTKANPQPVSLQATKANAQPVSVQVQVIFHKPILIKSKEPTPPMRWKPTECAARSGSQIPEGRHGHRAIPLDNKHVIFIGGGNEGLYGDVNILDLEKKEWFQPQIKGYPPPANAAFGAVLDRRPNKEDRILVFGGMETHCKFSNQLYELRRFGEVWEWRALAPLPVFGTQCAYPIPRMGHSFTIIKDQVYMFGGLANIAGFCQFYGMEDFLPEYLNDLYILRLSCHYPHGMWIAPDCYGIPPAPRESHSAVAYYAKNSAYNKLIVYGGMNGRRLGDVAMLDLDTMFWSHLPVHMPCSPVGRSLHSACLIGPKMYVFGGWTETKVPYEPEKEVDLTQRFQCVNSMGCLNVETMTWEKVKVAGSDPNNPKNLPKPRAGHCAFAHGNRMYIMGGRDGYSRLNGRQVCFNDVWQLDVGLPAAPSKCKLVKAEAAEKSELTVSWNPVPGADSYVLQISEWSEGNKKE